MIRHYPVGGIASWVFSNMNYMNYMNERSCNVFNRGIRQAQREQICLRWQTVWIVFSPSKSLEIIVTKPQEEKMHCYTVLTYLSLDKVFSSVGF